MSAELAEGVDDTTDITMGQGNNEDGDTGKIEDATTTTAATKIEDSEGGNDGGGDEVVVPDPTSGKGETVVEKAKGGADAGAVDDGDDPNDDDDGRDSDFEGPIVGKTGQVASGTPSGGGNKLLKELDDEAPKTFPQVLMEILTNDEDSDTISWLPHGRSFIIYKKKKFASSVLPKFFKATKFTSFTRKLNRWGFTRVTRGPEMGSYYHKMFLRDDPQLCLRMSSHSANKYHEPQQLIPNPMQPGMPFMPFGMPGIMPGIPMQMNPVDLSQQNQIINQQLQQLQWQQFQLQQFQQQQQQQQQHGTPHGPPPGQQPPPPHGHHLGQQHHPGMHHPLGPPGVDGHMQPPMHQHHGMHPHHDVVGPHQGPSTSDVVGPGGDRGPGEHHMALSNDPPVEKAGK